MGYDFHITRAEHWSSNEGQEIKPEEWLAIRETYPELIAADDDGPKGVGKYFTLWQGSTEYPETWLIWVDGNIETKNPDKPTIQKLLQIAKQLNAQVQGDDGEIYDETYLENIAHDTQSETASKQDASLDKKSLFVGALLNCLLFGAANFYVGEFRKGITKLILLYFAIFASVIITLPLFDFILPHLTWIREDALTIILGSWLVVLLFWMPWNGYATVNRYNKQRDCQ